MIWLFFLLDDVGRVILEYPTPYPSYVACMHEAVAIAAQTVAVCRPENTAREDP